MQQAGMFNLEQSKEEGMVERALSGEGIRGAQPTWTLRKRHPVILEKGDECGMNLLMGFWKLKVFSPSGFRGLTQPGGVMRMSIEDAELCFGGSDDDMRQLPRGMERINEKAAGFRGVAIERHCFSLGKTSRNVWFS